MKKLFNSRKFLVLTLILLLLGSTAVYAASRYGFDNRTGVNLHYIEADASSIDLKATGFQDPTVYMSKNGHASGMNGGFFDPVSKILLSIAVVNGRPVAYTGQDVSAEAFEFGNGGVNAIGDYGATAGTIIWDGDNNELKLVKLFSGWEIHSENLVSNTNNYWAQGGASLSLNDDANWGTIADKDEGYAGINGTGKSQRSAMLMSWDKKKVYLVVTDTRCTGAEFRTAIKETFTWQIDHGMDGIFLDGSTCAQLRYDDKNKVDHGRNVSQVIVLK